MHPEQKTTDPDVGYAELCTVVWEYLIRDWDRFGERSKEVANDIFRALAEIQRRDRAKYEATRASTSYRLGRMVTRWKTW
jgi:hypothetical protein